MRKHCYVIFVICTLCASTVIWAINNIVVPPVFVTAKKLENHTFTHGEKSVITQAEMSQTGVTSLAQALQALGGVQLQDTNGNGNQVALSMRGFGVNASSNTLLMVNGIPITNPDLAPPDLNAIPIQEIELVEVIAGSESVMYGDQAVGGVINVVTRKSTNEKISLSCNAGSYNARACYGAISNHYRELQYGLNVMSSHTDNYRANNDYDQNRLSGAINYAYATGNWGVDYQAANERLGYPGGLTAEQVFSNRRQASNNTNFFRDWNGYVQISNEQKLNDNWRLETDLVRRAMSGQGVLSIPFTQSRMTNFIRPQLKGVVGKALVTGGLDYNNDHYHLASLYGLTNDTQKKYGLFGVVNYPLSQRMTLSLGARGAQQNNQLDSGLASSTINRALATTAGFAYQLTSTAKVYLRRAGSFRFPKADEDASTTNNLPLRPQRGVAYESGMKWLWQQWTNKVALFQLNLRDEITFDPTQTAKQPFGSNRNLSPTTRRGFSLSEQYQATEKLLVSGQYNYVNARFQSGSNAGNRIPLVSEINAHLGLNYHFLPRWNFYSEAMYTGNQYPANDDANIAGKMGGYTVYNMNFRYSLKNFSAILRFNNLLNKYYYFYTVFQPGTPDSEFFYPAPARNMLLTLKYVFG